MFWSCICIGLCYFLAHSDKCGSSPQFSYGTSFISLGNCDLVQKGSWTNMLTQNIRFHCCIDSLDFLFFPCPARFTLVDLTNK